MEEEVRNVVHGGLYERSTDRPTHRSGDRSRRWETRLGSNLLEVNKLREGSYFPGLLEPPVARIERWPR